ncbi:AfsR/SARP family transcriptional regulator [Arthrobacter ramosus]|uniref:BTAD domain-containing putative transcriptional regulator n=1 Tax=Arthrobacter ramosus TaxID=1672 RepID=A0ABV5Y3Z5_ARTRM|nr:BTAD domain-containing putative transcriptional regulator [Arthrobacter ramosus]
MVLSSDPQWSLTLLNGWRLTRDGRRQKVAHRQQRLITALALLGERPRTFLSGLLWPDSSDAQAAVGLRVSIWHINHELPGLLDADGNTDVSVALSREVMVDIIALERELDAPASKLSDSYPKWERLRTAELLPGWYEDWILVEQERFRALRTAALDSIASYHLSQGNTEETKAASKLAIALEPFRESSYRLLIQAHLATGDLVSALETYRSFAADLRQEFGVGPSPSLAKLIDGAVGNSGRQMDFDSLPLSQMLPSLRPVTAKSEAPGVNLGWVLATQKL